MLSFKFDFIKKEKRHSYILPIHIPKRDHEDNFLAEINILRNMDKIEKREDVQEIVKALLIISKQEHDFHVLVFLLHK